MNRYQILIEYVGTKYIGWQIQDNGVSIQKTLQLILSKLLKQKIIVFGSGRTDKGVHAIEQSAHFDVTNKILNINKLIKSLNFFLNKKKISIKNIKKRTMSFHARHSAKERTYIYLIRNSISSSVINNHREWHIIKNLDLNMLKKGARKYIGTHDFSTFRASNCNSKSAVRTISKVSVSKSKNLIIITFESKSFIKSQVRSMVGCLKYLGEKKWTIKKFVEVFKSKKRINCAPLAPPHALYLKKIIY